MIKTQTLKGFRDFLPVEAKKRQFVVNILKQVFESYGFEPLETPALEYEEILLGKYGDEGDKLMYRFEDNGKRKVALRYDQTVPLARVVAQYVQELPMPFKRYQIQNVWRSDNTQKGRFREFLQCDIDSVGISSPLSDAEIIACALDSMEKLKFYDTQIWINDREILDRYGLSKEEIIILDKLEKIGDRMVIDAWRKNGRNNAEKLFKEIKNSKPSEKLSQIFATLSSMGYKENQDFAFVPHLARGLNYYTSTIFELKLVNTPYQLSFGGGGRYDNLIGLFTNKQIPAVGFSFGFDRIMEAMGDMDLFPIDLTTTNVLVTIFSKDLENKSLELAQMLREKNINTELYLDSNAKMEKQLKYADKKQIPYVVIIGPDEAKNNTVTVKNLKNRTQKTLPADQLLDLFKQ